MSTDSSTKRQATSSSKRQSTRIEAPRPPVTVHPTALIANHAIITGTHPVTIGPEAVLHPYSRISSVRGPVVIGQGCIIAERATVGWTEDGGTGDADGQQEVVLGNNVVVESAAEVRALDVGDHTVIDAEVKVAKGVRIGKVCWSELSPSSLREYLTFLIQYCKINKANVVPPDTRLEDFTVLYGVKQMRMDTTTKSNPVVQTLKARGHAAQIDALKKLIPNNLAKCQ